MLLLLLLVVASLGWWGYSETSPVALGPASTVFPETLPNAPPPQPAPQ